MLQLPCTAYDWGYETLPPSSPTTGGAQTQFSTQYRQQDSSSFAPSKTFRTSLHPEPATTNRADLLEQAAQDWLQLYAFAAGSQLSEDQKSMYHKNIIGDATSQGSSSYKSLVLSALRFWPDVRKVTTRNLDQVENYRDLIKALLRAQLRFKPSSIVGGQELAREILGPSRIAVPGEIPLTEDSINSYCDMACFLYEQKNPGHTMDAVENRALFAKVIVDKFKDAPSTNARLAMINFDLSWARFKIVWADATPSQRKELVKQWTELGSNSAPSSPILNVILNEGPWKDLRGKVSGL